MSNESVRLLGDWLKQRREELDISLEQAEEETRIRARYLEALEAEDYDTLPDPVVGRGFLRNYAVFLELDPQEASDRFDKKMLPPDSMDIPDDDSSPFTGPFRPVPLHDMPSQISKSRTNVGALAAVILVLVVSLVVWQAYPYIADFVATWQPTLSPTLVPTFTSQPQNTRSPATTYTPTTISPETRTPTTTTETETTPTPELTLTSTVTPLPSPSPSPSPPIYTGIFLELVLTDTSWVQVTVDGVRQFQGELESDTYRSWYGDERIELRVGNAGAALVTVNGEFLGTLGEPGEVVDRVFEKVDGGVSEATFTPEVTGTLTTEPTEPPTANPTTEPTVELTIEPTSEATIAPPTPTLTVTIPVSPTIPISPTTPVTPTANP